jgi:soluble lytic murein transglycosylase
MIIVLLKEAFVDMDFTLQGEKEFLEKYWKIIKKDDFQARVDRLLTDRELAAARRMTRYLDDGYKKVYDARIALIRGKSGVDDLIRQIPNEYKNDAGLAYERLKWRAKRNMEDGVISLLKKSPKIVTNPEKWWSLRWKYTKEFISQGNYKDAYFIIRKHSITTDNVKISKAEWISGWLALRFLNNPTEAINHFERMYNVVSTPVSLARGAYWLGRAYKQKGLDDKAKEWFLKAAEHPLTYYGQLGYVEAGDRKYSLPKAQTISKSDLSNYKKNELAKAAYIMMQIGENYTGKLFSVAAAEEAQSFGEKMLIAQFGLDIGKYDYAVRTAKKIYSNTKEPILNALYPIFKLETINQRPIRNPSKEVVLAIIRQESEFDKDALSGAGARGLMQLMPSTAKYVAKRLGIKYDKSRLVSDVNYNITLGSAYLADRINIFDGSYVLAFASYNAGEGNVKKWIKKNGDPRNMKLYDVIDWVEKIPFSETNNYVQRVMENVQVYRLALTDERYNKITIDQDLIR